MSMAILDRFESERQEQVAYVDHLLGEVDGAGRDLSETEKASLGAARERINALDEQIQPLMEFQQLRQTSANVPFTAPGAPRQQARSLSATANAPAYLSAGHAMLDILATIPHKNHELAGLFGPRHDSAAARLAAMRDADRIERAANQLTSDTPGILPVPVVGTVLSTIDASRPLISSLGAKPMGGIPGTKFQRPRVTQHTLAGKQAAEKTALATQQMKIQSLEFLKETYGGWVNISRQDIDWTSPTAWDILIKDLADSYSIATETATATAFSGVAGMNGPVTVATNDLAGWATALYEAAALVYQGCKRLPDRLWVSLDVWAAIGPIVDTARLVFPPGAAGAGSSSLVAFSGNMFELDRIVVPSFPAGTAVIGVSNMAEFYEERIGLLTAVEPSILGVEVAYGGYTAFGVLESKAFTELVAPVVP
jgi:hypothetical protein